MATVQVKEEIAFHRKMVSLLRKEISQVDQNSSKRYIKEFSEEFRSLRDVSSYDDLVIACFKADLVYIGDYHALHSSQSFAAQLLGEVASRSRQVILAMEMVYGRHQKILDRWMSSEIDEEEFKRRIRYDLDWGYDWAGFKRIFEKARQHGVRVFGIDCAPRSGLRYIRRRDRYAAARIADVFKKNPQAKVVVVIGESHLASGHLPDAVRKQLRKHNLERRSVRVLQNLEEIYWQLVERGEEHRDVALLGKHTYCFFNTSPIAKYESYRQTIDRWNSEADHEDSDLDLTPTLYNMIDTILGFLKVNKFRMCVRRETDCIEFLVDHFPEVYSESDAKSLERVLEAANMERPEIDDILRRIERKGSCYIPLVNSIFIGQFSLVHGGEEAAHFVNLALRGDLGNGFREPRSRADQFYEAAMEEALGYFGSKLIDPSRNHFFETDLYRYHRKDREFIESNTEYSYEEFNRIIKFILLHKRFENDYRELEEIPPPILEGIGTPDRKMLSILTHELGYYLGQQLYDAYHGGVIDRKEILALFRSRFEKPGSALETYIDLAEKVGRQ